MKRTISAMVGKGSLNHNSREFYASNVDPNRSHLNIEFCREDIRNVYHELFDEAQERFNGKQTRNDRRIEDTTRKSVPQNRKSLSMKLSYRLEIRTIQASIRNWQKRLNSA